jgi:NhaA family Na+:H+ antiporter
VAATRALRFCIDRFLLLPIGAAIALVWCNAAAESYFTFAYMLRFLVNDVGMAFFFALITQEVVEAMMPRGALHSWRRWGVAVVAAAGGIVGAALWYVSYVQVQHEAVLLQAWPVACAVDVALAYYVLKAIAPRTALLPFVLLAGIATNLFGVLVVVYQSAVLETRGIGMLLVLLAIGMAIVLRAWRVRTFWPYLAISGTIFWWAFSSLGVYPGLAFLPLVALLPREPRSLDLFAPPPDDDAIHHFEHEWNDLVQVILFFFGLVNAGVVLRGYDTGTWAVLTAALVGRPAGMLAAIGAAVAVGLHLPPRVGWRDTVVATLAASSGFAFAMFYASGLLPAGPVREQITLGALATIAGALMTFAAARMLRVGRYARRHPTARASTERLRRQEGEAKWHTA